uniref:LRRCT domain-containing protein n=1 Tax=Plectus sambesii TaxID=2011161 RepID=A0A914VEF4_9BILA
MKIETVLLLSATALSMAMSLDQKTDDCPSTCDCERTDYGLHVTCNGGGITDIKLQTIFRHIPKDVAVLEIIGPEDNENKFSLNGDIARFSTLRQLHLVNCGLPSLGKHIFRGMTALRTLNLQRNRIEYASESSFDGLENLEYLDLSYNWMHRQRLPTGVFSRLRSLRSLSLAHNGMTHFSNNLLSGLARLETLILDGNRPTPHDLSTLFIDAPNLTRLEVNHCRLKTLDELQFDKAPRLHTVGLGWNDLSYVRSIDLKPLLNLTSLDLSGNSIATIPPCAFCGFSIHTLSLAYNKLGDCYSVNATVPGESLQPLSFESLPLYELDLSFNNFKQFDSSALGVAQKTLRILHLSGNPLETISSDAIRGLKLKGLHAAQIGKSVIPYFLPLEFERLAFLNLSGNELDVFPEEVASLFGGDLRTLDVSNNELTTMPDAITYLNTVYLNDNPWDCRCHLGPMRDYMLRKDNYQRRSALGYDRVRCSTPPAVRNETVASLTRPLDCAVLFGASYGLSQASELGILLAGMLAAILLAAVVVAATCYTREQRHKGSYQTREDSRCHLNPNNLDPSSSDISPISPYTPPSTLPISQKDERLF